jgi:hypothetical protein
MRHEIEESTCTSDWLKNAVKQLDARDAVDALYDAKALLAVAQARLRRVEQQMELLT